MLTVVLGLTGSTKSPSWTFPWYAIFPSVRTEASALYANQLGAGNAPVGRLTKFANAVWRLWDNLASSAVTVDALNVPKTMGTAERCRGRKHRGSDEVKSGNGPEH